MEARRLTGKLHDPGSRTWQEVPAEHVPLAAAPISGQQSRYVRTAWADRVFGVVRDLEARAAHDGESFFLRLTWSSPGLAAKSSGKNPLGNPLEGPDAFSDSVAVMFPANGDAAIDTKGSEQAPVGIWRWAEDAPDAAENLVASGLGTLRPAEDGGGPWARSSCDESRWSVVLGRAIEPEAAGAVPALSAGAAVKVGFAVWAGANQERAGIKSYSQRWIELELEG